MANVLNRTTKEYRTSVNTPDFPTAEWIHEPDLSLITGFPSKYWIITGDIVSLMTLAERQTIDAAELEAQRDGVVAQVDDLEGILRAIVLIMKDEINLLRAQHSLPARTSAQLRTAIRNKLGDING